MTKMLASTALIFLALTVTATADMDVETERTLRAALAADFEQLKHDLTWLSAAEGTQRIEALRARALALPTPVRQDLVDHIVVLYVENHAADNVFGCMDLPGFDGFVNGSHTIPVDPDDPSKGNVTIKCGTGEYVCTGGPGYNLFSGKFKPGTNSHTYPYDKQSDDYSVMNGASGVAATAFSPEQLPVKTAIAHNFGVFNRMYTSVPSASTPNHLMTQSATSCGLVDNIMWNNCGGPKKTFPQMTMYDSMYIQGVPFAFYLNSSCGVHGNPPCDDEGEAESGVRGVAAIERPDVMMDGVARYKQFFDSMDKFYDNAAQGTLPALSWLLPPVQACDHPCYDCAKGERLLKDVYEALRASPKWDKTLLFVTYDDAGAYYDHQVPPFEGVPNDEAPCHLLDQCSPHSNKFDFKRLGLRTTAMLISPLVAKGSVFQEPKQGPFPTSQFDHTSLPATLKKMFNLTGFLTQRDRWAGTFDELLLDTPRTDTPPHLPDAPPFAAPWDPAPPNDTAANGGQHCSLKEQVCKGPDHTTAKQRRLIDLFAHLVPDTGSTKPDADTVNEATAARWLSTTWTTWMGSNDGVAVERDNRVDEL